MLRRESGQHQARNLRPFLFGWCLFGLAVVLALMSLSYETKASFDFRNFYSAGHLLRTDRSHLYDIDRQQQVQNALISPGEKPLPFIHPAYEALLYVPFSMVSYGTAYSCFVAFNLLVVLLIFLSAYPIFASTISVWQPRPGLMLFAFLPVFVAICQGQNSLLFLFLCCLVWLKLERGEEFTAGCLLALGLCKFQLAIPIAVLWAARRGWRFAAGFGAGGAGIAGLSLALAGRAATASLVRLLSVGSLATDQSAAMQNKMAITPSAMPNLVGLLYPVTRGLPPRLAFLLVAAASASLMAWCMCLVRRSKNQQTAFAITILCALLVSYHLYIYDLTLLILPVALMAGRVSNVVLHVLYGTQCMAILVPGRQWLCLLALPSLWLLVESAMSLRQCRVAGRAAEAGG